MQLRLSCTHKRTTCILTPFLSKNLRRQKKKQKLLYVLLASSYSSKHF